MSLSASDTDRALRLAIREGIAWALMVGLGETYFVANAVRLGATTLELGLLVTLPLALAGIGPLLTLVVLRHRNRKSVAVAAALAQSMALITVGLLEWTGTNSPTALIALVCLYQGMGQAAGTAWSSWYGDLVPPERRGRYFARRNRGIYAATCVGLVAGGALLQALEVAPPGAIDAPGGVGYAVLYATAVGCRLVSALHLMLAPEPRLVELAGVRTTATFVRSGAGRSAIRLLGVAAMFHFAAYIAAPYFAPYMLGTLHFTYLEYMAASVWLVAVKALATSVWGRSVDRIGARRTFRIALFLVAIVPLPWILAQDLALVLLAQGLSGFAWCAYELGYFATLLESTTPATRPAIFAAQSLLVGWSQLSAAMVAAWVVTSVDGGYRTIFALSAGLRLGVALLVPLWIRRAVVIAPVRQARLAFRAMGMRPGGGLSRRPVFDAQVDPEPDRE